MDQNILVLDGDTWFCRIFGWRSDCSTSRSDMYEWRRSQVARALLTYVRKFPLAQDTLRGIAQFWLPHEGIESDLATIQKVLEELVARGYILQHKGKDSKIHYRINRRKSR